MTKRTKEWVVVWCKVVGSMATTLSAAMVVMGPHESLSAFQILTLLSATFGTGALTLSSALGTVPGQPDPLSTGQVRQILGISKRRHEGE